jgi:hypothetical protein
MPTAARSAAVAIGKASGTTRRLTRLIAAGRLETYIEVVRRPKPCTNCCRIELMRAEIVEDERAVIQQSLDVDKLPRPVELLENALTKLEATGSLLRSWVNVGDLIGGSQAQYFWSRALRRRLAMVAASKSVLIAERAASRGTGGFHHGEDFPQFDPPVGLDHDDLAPLKPRIAIK